jgi:hypothetical protein
VSVMAVLSPPFAAHQNRPTCALQKRSTLGSRSWRAPTGIRTL